MKNKKQFTFENIGILDENELSRISSELGDGYGGYSSNDIFDKLLPKGYSLAFINRLMSCHYLCILAPGWEFEKLLEEYKKTPIVEWKYIPCPTCKKHYKQIKKEYERVGDLLNIKGKLIKETKFDW